MKIDAKEILIASSIGDDVAVLLEKAIAAHTDTGRSASVTLKITVKIDKESGASKARGRVHASIPSGDDDSVTNKLPSVGLLTIANDHPGQQRIDQ